jgi:RNA-directed DNA polymerase
MQQRIYRAQSLGKEREVRNLQRILLRSKAVLLLSIKQVTQINKGKRTPGIDGITIDTDQKRVQIFNIMKSHSIFLHTPKPSYRTYIKKKNGKLRPLSIPVIKDRIYQHIMKTALEPQWEAIFEPTSYGFRPKRGCHDALAHIYLGLVKRKKQWVFEGDFKGCFDNLNQEYIMQQLHTFPGKETIQKWLKAGYIDNGAFHETTSGSGQGSIISPLIANIALHGMEKQLGVSYCEKKRKNGEIRYENKSKFIVVRYADDFVCLCESYQDAMSVYQKLEPYLESRGLELETSKTRVVSILEGFDFLGFNVRLYKNETRDKLLIKPSKDSMKKARTKISGIGKSCQGNNVKALINKLNPVITGIGNYWKPMVSKRAFTLIDHHTFRTVRRYIKRLHPKKSLKWIKRKYYPYLLSGEHSRRWTLVDPESNKELKHMEDIPIRRHVKIKFTNSPFDSELKEYFEKRKHTKVYTNSYYYARL